MAKIMWFLVVPILAMLWLYHAYAGEPGAAHALSLSAATIDDAAAR